MDDSTSSPSEDPATVSSCRSFWGDPNYGARLSRDVLDRAATAPSAGPSDPDFYALTGEDVEKEFSEASAPIREAADPLATWMREQPARGSDADLDAFEDAWAGLASACAPSSEAAAWVGGDGEAGTKPAALVCADVFDTPSTLTIFHNANVLTSNMFKLVGRSAMTVPEDRIDEVQATRDLLEEQIDVVDDDAVREALTDIQQPFTDALHGDLYSDGLQEPLDRLGPACTDAGYFVSPSDDDSQHDGDDSQHDGLV
ncbi:hypothetical protein ACTXKZ_10310 [Brachybacterium alimentarium]|uniref:hypothetical protein n=1 Tax=Brachybacterium alimentarium TaxID=47845 RepID=UPI003FD07836